MNLCLEISTNPCICKCGFLIPPNSRVGSIRMASFWTVLDTRVDLMLILSDLGNSPSVINQEAL